MRGWPEMTQAWAARTAGRGVGGSSPACALSTALGWVKQRARIFGKVSYEGARWRAPPAQADERVTMKWTSGEQCATIVVMSIESLRSVRDHLSEFVDRVEGQHERIVITRNGHAAAVLISLEDLAQLEETIDVLSDPAALADIREADEAYARGDVVRGVDAVRQLRR
jgi:prevent-host-death family protein